MKVLVFGGRDYENSAVAWDALDHLHERFGITKVIHGSALGADRLGDIWAWDRRVLPIGRYRAAWDILDAPGAVIKYNRFGKPYNALAGHARNQRMIDEGRPDMALEFPGGNGTADMRKRLDAAGIPVIQVYVEPFGTEDWREINAAADFARRQGRQVADLPLVYEPYRKP